MGKYIKRLYLSAPYSHPNKLVRQYRVKMANQKAAELMERGYRVFSPLSHSHPISKYCQVDPCDHDFWLRQDLWILPYCDIFYIYTLKGWSRSEGVKREFWEAQTHNLEIMFSFNERLT